MLDPVSINGETYSFKQDHRDDTGHKSQWTISENEELRCFARTAQSGWRDEKKGWGLYIVNEQVDYLGIAAIPDHHRRLFNEIHM